ncbi:GNAT family N-acetyltransferase [Flavobacterium hibernum]|uniref:FemAB family protein n=1 Tax=Flavobacterium hibernum TaxID=37752 RepID=A0A0D0EJR8_9FLAO|nr:GNAT family N-acetyltransferase [Flavobacterium hibernum]KIO51295.1 FemAB family protein [Flavobacterium hibernum]OXA85090.1 FemAB family protein [Flavobacterium hibernum]STO19459.1 FemAB-related protein, PEP-CTERM system-associated [Flavobacterium hibernum]
MTNYTIKKYHKNDYEIWNAFIGQAKNATFLFHRDFIEYHQDRFEDFSLLIFEDEKLKAVLPANIKGKSVYSHQGLTYGGLVFNAKLKGEKVEVVLDQVLLFLKENSIVNFYYKPIPDFYLQRGNQDLDFFLFKRGAILERKEMNLAINLELPLQISKSKLKHFRRIENLDLDIVEEHDFQPFWEKVLGPRLLEKFNVKPVHTKEEIALLKQNFPDNIKQYSVYQDDEIIAGITIFETKDVVKSQYGATSQKGEQVRALDFLFINLIHKYKRKGKRFFDMGIVNEENESGYHSGLLNQKEELGCSVYNQDFYKMEIK